MTSRRGAGGRRIGVVWTAQATADLEQIGAHIERDDPIAAARWIDKLLDAGDKVGGFPRSGRKVPELDRDDVRECVVGNYRVVYWIRGPRIDIVTVFEGHRLPPLRGLPRGRR